MKADKTPALREERGINQISTQVSVQLHRDLAVVGSLWCSEGGAKDCD